MKFLPNLCLHIEIKCGCKIRLFSDKTGKIYVGLLNYIKDFCDKNEINYDIDDDVNEKEDLDIDKVNDFVKSLKPNRKEKI